MKIQVLVDLDCRTFLLNKGEIYDALQSNIGIIIFPTPDGGSLTLYNGEYTVLKEMPHEVV